MPAAATEDAAMSNTHFGFESVDERDKARRVRGVFDSVAPRYDVMNDLMSLGLHRAWKAFTVLAADVRPGHRVLDLADIGGEAVDDLAGELVRAGLGCEGPEALLAEPAVRVHE